VSDGSRNIFRRLTSRLTGRLQLERIAAVDAKVAKFGRAQREELNAQRRQLEAVIDELSKCARAADLRALTRRVEDVQASLVQQDRTISDALARAGRLDQQGVDDRRFARRLEAMLRSGRPIVVGPWTGEVGFELLYWVPFVRWVTTTYAIPPERLIIVSRGGAAPWYDGLAARYIDIFSHFTPDEFRAATIDAKKQRAVGEFDARVVHRIIEHERLAQPWLLHPGMMYRLFMPFWKELATAARVEGYARFGRLTTPAAPVLKELPREYVAARFYFSECFPDTPSNRSLVEDTLDLLSRQAPVVLLNTPFAVDDHRDIAATGHRVVTIPSEHMTPAGNLSVQTAVIAGARSFVGTYGGYSYLAPFVGVSSVAFYSEATFKPHHLHLAQRVFDRLGGATLVPLDVAALPLVRQALGNVPAAAS
jgi:hypothetical protein